MAKIKVNDLKPTGSELFSDSESFFNDLSGDELEQAMGGLEFRPIFTTITNSPFCIPTIIIRTTYTSVVL